MPSTSKEFSSALTTGNEKETLASGSTDVELLEPRKSLQDQIPFFSGNPFVEKVQGILHFYKEK